MELLRRALLIGCVLPGLWLLRLAPLEPLLTVVPVDFAARQREEAAVPDALKTEEQRRNAALPLSVYVEELLQYNVFSAVGPEWDRLLRGIDALQPERGAGTHVFFRSDEEPMRALLDKLAAGGGATYVSFSRPGGDVHYRVERRLWTRQDFRPGAGFGGRPAPPAALFYPFRIFGLGSALAGLVFYWLLAGARGSGTAGRPTSSELAALGLALVLFAGPLIVVGGSIQALTRGLALTLPCWLVAAAGLHVFAGPGRNAPELLAASKAPKARGQLLREGLAFLAMAYGPVVFLISASMALWNR